MARLGAHPTDRKIKAGHFTLNQERKNIMKKLIGIVVASMVFANIGHAEMRMIEEAEVGIHTVFTICVDGYKFVVWKPYKKEGVSMVQFYEVRDGKSLPAKC